MAIMNFFFSFSFFPVFFPLMLQVAMLNSLIVFLFAYILRIDRDISLWFSSGLICIFSYSAFKRGFFSSSSCSYSASCCCCCLSPASLSSSKEDPIVLPLVISSVYEGFQLWWSTTGINERLFLQNQGKVPQ